MPKDVENNQTDAAELKRFNRLEKDDKRVQSEHEILKKKPLIWPPCKAWGLRSFDDCLEA